MSEKIAVIGLSFQYPGIDSVDEFDELLRNGKNITSDNANERGNLLGIADYKKLLGNIKCLSEIEYFDNNFFGIVKKEANEMSPEMKLSLMHSVQAIYDAGYSLEQMKDSECGMVVSQSNSPYRRLIGHGSSTAYFDSLPAMTGSNLAFYFDLKGPTYSVDSTCSSSLFAVYQACQVLLSKQADMMLAGGSQIIMPLDKSDVYELKGDGASAKDLLIPFDEKADGFILGEGTGFVLLKRYDDAIRDGDYIYGTILGTGISGTGATRTSVYAPDGRAQSQAIQRAWINAGISADDIDEIEAHGTATQLGDLNEINGLMLCLNNRKNPDKVMIGAVKSNIGHTSQAAGISSLIKTMLSFENNVIYPIANFNKPNPNIDFEVAKIKPVEKCISIPADKKRVVGIDSYGLNALNVHMVVENHIRYHQKFNVIEPINRILKLSAKTESSLTEYCSNILQMVKKGKRNINDLIYTLNTGRDDFKVRAVICFDTVEELCKKLEHVEPIHSDIEAGKEIVVPEYSDNDNTRELIAEAYIKGANIDFNKYYGEVIFRKVPAPGYAFDKVYSWFAEKKQIKTNGIKTPEKTMNSENQESIRCKVKRIWQEILETDEDIAEDETFFELGGNSMLGTMMIEMITEELEAEVTIADIYKYNTIRMLAEYICNQNNSVKNQYSEEMKTGEIEETPLSVESREVKAQAADIIIHDKVKEAWQKILETEAEIDDDDSFFDLGGNSVLVEELKDELNQVFSMSMNSDDIYENSTIEALTEYISNL